MPAPFSSSTLLMFTDFSAAVFIPPMPDGIPAKMGKFSSFLM
jgi:hypothetical protein